MLDRRAFLAGLASVGGAVAMSPRSVATLHEGNGPYGPRQAPDELGIALPAGFTARIVAVAGQTVVGTEHTWHASPDGGATFATDDGGWIYVSNSEVSDGAGGVGALRFDADGSIVGAMTLLSGTTRNCAGGPTPWGTWLSGEEYDAGRVWECHPTGARPSQPRPALGVFTHEAAAVDEARGHVYLTEDASDGRLYRFVADELPGLVAGRLEVMRVEDGAVSWLAVPDPGATSTPTRLQVPESTPFDGGEGIWFDGERRCYFTTKGDNRVWMLDVEAQALEIVYEPAMVSDPPVLTGVDNITIGSSGDLVVAEDTGAFELDLVIVTPDGEIAPLLTVIGQEGSELCGPAFSPDGSRLYFSSQRGRLTDAGTARGGGAGITYEVTGPFRRAAPAPTTTSSTPITTGSPTTASPSTRSAITPATVAAAAAEAANGQDSAAPLAIGLAAVVATGVGGLVWWQRRVQRARQAR